MERAIKHHFQSDIKEQTKLTGGYTFETWLLTLSDNSKVVFRTQRDFETSGGRKVIIADVLEREKFFYDSMNKSIGHICPEVYVVDGTKEYCETSYCIMEYIEGIPLNLCFDNFDAKTKRDIQNKIGEIAASINNVEIDSNHPYIKSRGKWEEYVANRLSERLTPLIHNEIITQNEVDQITSKMRTQKAVKTLSFLHLDMRRINMILNNEKIYILDAENCEFGDPLFELAVIDVGNELEPSLVEGYKNIYSFDLDIESDLYNYYKMERQALVTHLFTNVIKNNKQLTNFHFEKFYEVKKSY